MEADGNIERQQSVCVCGAQIERKIEWKGTRGDIGDRHKYREVLGGEKFYMYI